MIERSLQCYRVWHGHWAYAFCHSFIGLSVTGWLSLCWHQFRCWYFSSFQRKKFKHIYFNQIHIYMKTKNVLPNKHHSHRHRDIYICIHIIDKTFWIRLNVKWCQRNYALHKMCIATEGYGLTIKLNGKLHNFIDGRVDGSRLCFQIMWLQIVIFEMNSWKLTLITHTHNRIVFHFIFELNIKWIRWICMYFPVIWLNHRAGWWIVEKWTKPHFIWIASPKSITNQLISMKRFYDRSYRM